MVNRGGALSVIVFATWGMAGIGNRAAWADSVHTRQARSIRNVTIIGFKQARLEVVEKKTGARQVLDFDLIAAIRVDRKAELNRAETFAMLRKYPQAIDAYQVALSKASSGWERIWIQVRLLNLLARRGQIEKAAVIYIALAESIGDWVLQIAPGRNEIPADADSVRKAAAKLAAARKQSTSGKARQALTRFLERLGYDQVADDVRREVPGEISEAELTRLRRPDLWLDTWAEKKLKARQYDQLTTITDRLFANAVRADLPVVLYWQGRALLPKSKYDPAALKLLRVAIEFPRSRYAPYGLYYAAEAMSKSDRALYAKKAREELIARYGASRDLLVSQLVDNTRERLGK